MNAYKVYTDWGDYVILSDSMEKALAVGSDLFAADIESEKQDDLKRATEELERFRKKGEEAPDYLQKEANGEGHDHYAGYKITKVKLVGKVQVEKETTQ